MKKLLLILLTISGCSSINNIDVYEEIDQNNKTVLISRGHLGFEGEIKRILRKEGFKLYVKSSDKDYSYAQKDIAKYEIFISGEKEKGNNATFYHNPITGENKYNFQITFINLKTGTEVFYYSGIEWESKIPNNFKKILRNKNDTI